MIEALEKNIYNGNIEYYYYKEQTMKNILLNGIWKLIGQNLNSECDPKIAINASVPGSVDLDLSRKGYLPSDLFMGENILETQKFERYDWWYERSFDAPVERNNVYLVFEGVDCLAEYFLNGVKFGESENMLISHEFRIDEYLRDGENTLTVHIKSAIVASEKLDYPIRLFHARNIESCQIRKAPHMYGWDIMPRAIGAGLWRDVKLEVRDDIYFSQAFVHAEGDHGTLYYTLETDYDKLEGVEIEFEGYCKDSKTYQRSTCSKKVGRFGLYIPNPKLWFPYGYGEANVYDCFARLYKDKKLIHETKLNFGIRDIKLDRRDPSGEDKGEFRFYINGIDTMCRGSNWVPLDAYHCRDAERYDKALELVRDVGCNILRCWGGNVYEDHKFYDFCDRNGIMIWQDFSMACAQYPESDEFRQNMKNEVTSVVRKLRNHPCIILWAGDNEVDSMSTQYDPDGNKITRELIPQCIRDNDLGRPYLPSSPYITHEMFAKGNLAQNYDTPLVEDHLWGPRDYFKSDFYSTNKAKFVSETGYHGCPSLESIKKFITPDHVWPYHNNPEWTLHSTEQDGNDHRVMLMEKQVKQLFGEVPSEPEDYILASQISQAEAKKYFIERIRVDRPEKTGIIWWNLLDGWPQMSDAVVDYYFTKKLAYNYIKRAQAPFTIAAGALTNWNLNIYACNDTLEKVSGHYSIKDAETDEVLYESDFTAGENSTTALTALPLYYSEKKILIFEWSANGEAGFNHYLCGYPPISLEF